MSNLTVPDLLAHALTRVPGDRVCVVEGDRSLTYREVDERADRLVQAWRAHGIGPGDRVALLAYSELEYTEIQVAAQRAGIVLAPLNFRLAVPELESIVRDCGPVLLIHGPGLEEQARALGLPAWHLGECGAGDPYEETIAPYAPNGERPILDAAAPSALLYTSGTTGRAKGAVISNLAFWTRVNTYTLELGSQSRDTFLYPIPMFHVSSSIAYSFMYRGCTVVQQKLFEVEGALDLLERHRVSHAVFVPTMIARLLDLVERNPARLDALQVLQYGGSAIAPDLLRRGMALLGCRFQQGYGLTEAVNLTTLHWEDHDPDLRPDLLTSCGTDTISYEVRVVDGDDHRLPAGEVGEIVARGPGVMDGYWNDPETSAQALRGGWLHTGDLGYRSEEGYLFITDRLKDVIVSGGENVYSREVEDVLHDFPGVLEVAVVGVPSEQWGEAVHAVVVPSTETELVPGELISHCRARLAGYKAPKSVEIVDDLPKNASGKILKREVRERYWAGRGRSVN
jgi:long-chain acyl-CoA synthetase